MISPLVVRGFIKNISDVDGAEVVQVYVGGARSLRAKPVRELKGFKKIFVKAGQTELFEIQLDKADLQNFDSSSRSWKFDHGVYTISVGTSSRKLIASFPVLM